ncbi:MAG: cytochrome c3 family protein [Acidobacteria bacterium]|nr:cytochrome c3 family protein [Acidobacteriota bacterium]
MRWFAAAAISVSAILFAQLPDVKIPRPAPEQPLPFSHKTHAGINKTACAHCHPVPDPGDFATIPKTQVCMGCHQAVKKDSPHIQKLAGFHAEAKKIPWAPVYRVPDWVSFSHKKHLGVEGVKCATCHGEVATYDVLRREKDISMAGCMDCHRAKGASNECLLCHDQR